MNIKTLPGTTIELPCCELSARALLSSLFLAGGLVLSQVSSLTDLPPHVLQNWVKRGFLPPPVNKKYSLRQFCRIAIINLLKDNLQIEVITKLLKYAASNMPGASAELIDDAEVYCYFVEALILAENDIDKLDTAIKTALKNFAEPYLGARGRLAAVIKAMAILYISSQIKGSAELLLRNLGLMA